MSIKETIIQADGKLEKQLLEYMSIHTGKLSITVEGDQEVSSGDTLYSIERNGLTTLIRAGKCGRISNVNLDCDRSFVGFDVSILTLEHPLTEEEKEMLREEMEYTFICAENGAKYYLTLERGAPPLTHVGAIIHDGDVLAVSMIMKNKREIVYHGPPAEIKKIYVQNEEQKKTGEKLFGVVPLDQT